MRDFLVEEFEIHVSVNTISNFLQENKISRKKVKSIAIAIVLIVVATNSRECSQLLRDEWYTCLADWSYEQLMYVDESAANERSLDRKYGWSRKGVAARCIAPFRRSEKWSILPVYTHDGFIDWEVVRGSYNAAMFIEFIRNHVIPHTTPYPGPRSVLIMDNAKIHHSEVYLIHR
jgi:hypothetical protein